MAIPYNSNYDETIPFSDVTYPIHIEAGLGVSVVIPGAATTQYQALFCYNDTSNVFVRLNDPAIVPAAGSPVLVQYNEFKPEKRYVRGGDEVFFITPDGEAYCSMSLRQLQG